MKYILFFSLLLVFTNCTQKRTLQRYDVFLYEGAYGDADYEAIDYHYWHNDEPKDDGYVGVLLLGDPGDQIPVDVYKERKEYYVYEWNPTNGLEYKRTVTQFKDYIIKPRLKEQVFIHNMDNDLVKFEHINNKQIKARAIVAIWLTTGNDTIVLNPREYVLLNVPDDEFNVSVGIGDGSSTTYTF